METKPQPRAYPLATSVVEALEQRIQSEPGVELITAGRPSSHRVPADVVLVVGAAGELDSSFAHELVGIVRRSMRDESLIVDVHCVKALWQERSP